MLPQSCRSWPQLPPPYPHPTPWMESRLKSGRNPEKSLLQISVTWRGQVDLGGPILGLQLPAMLPAEGGARGRSLDLSPCGSGPPETTKDILVIHEDDVEEWAFYLREIFLHVVKQEAILLYPLETFSLRPRELLSLNSYKCKLLIISNRLLKDLTPKKCQFLEKVLHSPESVVTLLCGVESANQLYKLLHISQSRWEMSTEQEPDDIISVIKQIIFRESEGYLEVNTQAHLRMQHSGENHERKERKDSEVSTSTGPLALVLPNEIQCENPGEIFILLRDEVIGETLEIEFMSNYKRIIKQPTRWNKKVWSMKALDFPAGSVIVKVYCDGNIKATTEIKYYTTAKTKECPLSMASLGDSLCQGNMEDLDGILAAIFKHEIPYYEFQSLPTEIYSKEEYTHVKELPTLLHCGAKFGLRNLATHLLQCPGARWASQTKNTDGFDPAHIAERHGHKELKKIFEDFAIQEAYSNNEQENDYKEDFISFTTYSPSTQYSACHHGKRKAHRSTVNGAETSERAMEGKENESSAEAKHSQPEVDTNSSENQYDDLYVFIPGINLENNPQQPLTCGRPPLPPPRLVSPASQLERPHFKIQGKIVEDQMERREIWSDPFNVKQDTRDEPKGEEEEEDEKEQEEDEDPYTFAEIDDNEYDMILAHMSIKKKTGSRSFIMNRPPAPTPRPVNIFPSEEKTPYIAQVFQQKAARRQYDSDKFHGLPKKPDRVQMESPAFPIPRDCLTVRQEELISLQEKVKNGKMSVDEALEKFKHWQMNESGLEMIQQEKLRQLRDSIIGKRPEEENVYNKLSIVHRPSGNTAHNENMLYRIPFSNELPARLQVEKEFGFLSSKDH
ncbi:B-cell scaffold protein with ankyrin repeats isoform X2 [Dipodomys spectabilis]|uniref:B-cell scaffold protein with ankyrin repeats isoform X2 n=1 Tax=Dipodomys spectabilis TaxID=105255 RepID=UPI001C536EF1|nr:B-cell scaffold protein with ankyrin repeats isoform X2 [Dipodomys spectabilis]